MSTFSGRKNSGMEIPDYAIERIARCLLPMIQTYYERHKRTRQKDGMKK